MSKSNKIIREDSPESSSLSTIDTKSNSENLKVKNDQIDANLLYEFVLDDSIDSVKGVLQNFGIFNNKYEQNLIELAKLVKSNNSYISYNKDVSQTDLLVTVTDHLELMGVNTSEIYSSDHSLEYIDV